MIYSIINVSGGSTTKGEWFQIHKVGCADIAKGLKSGEHEGHWDMEAESAEKLAEKDFQDTVAERGEDAGWEAYMWRVMPCCKQSKNQEAAQ